MGIKVTASQVKDALKATKDIVEIVDDAVKLAEEHNIDVADQASKFKDKACGVLKNAKRSVGERVDQMQQSAEGKKAAEKRKEEALTRCLPPMDAVDFYKAFEDAVPADGNLENGYMNIPGYFAILTMPSSRTKDLEAYKNVFVGAGSSLGLEVYKHLFGLGNVDVYSDFKYKQPMKVLLYVCDQDRVQAEASRLCADLRAFESYNHWDIED